MRVARVSLVCLLAGIAGCGDSPTQPGPVTQTPPPPPPVVVNNAPVISSIAVQGTRANEPANFAELTETVTVTASVSDTETAVEQLTYNWTATAGSFSGSGSRVSWQAPATGAPTVVTLTLEVVERYGTNLEHRVTRTASVSLHDSAKEVGDMARQFLLDFSDTNLKDASLIMRNFAAPAMCPEPAEVNDERDQVTNHYLNFRMIDFRIGPATVTVNFKGACPVTGRKGDACAIVPSFWHSVDLRTNREERVDGNDLVAAIYSTADSRWWLCASNYDGRALLSRSGQSFYIR